MIGELTELTRIIEELEAEIKKFREVLIKLRLGMSTLMDMQEIEMIEETLGWRRSEKSS